MKRVEQAFEDMRQALELTPEERSKADAQQTTASRSPPTTLACSAVGHHTSSML